VVLSVMLVVGLVFGVLAMPIQVAVIIHKNTKMFWMIMSYWSKSNRRKKGN